MVITGTRVNGKGEEEKVYLLLQEEELRLVVFGDENSKRSVSNVKQIVVE